MGGFVCRFGGDGDGDGDEFKAGFGNRIFGRVDFIACLVNKMLKFISLCSGEQMY